jgi:hypothetical protein
MIDSDCISCAISKSTHQGSKITAIRKRAKASRMAAASTSNPRLASGVDSDHSCVACARPSLHGPLRSHPWHDYRRCGDPICLGESSFAYLPGCSGGGWRGGTLGRRNRWSGSAQAARVGAGNLEAGRQDHNYGKSREGWELELARDLREVPRWPQSHGIARAGPVRRFRSPFLTSSWSAWTRAALLSPASASAPVRLQ